MMDVASLTMTPLICVAEILEMFGMEWLSHETVSYMAAGVSFFLLVKIFDWLRLFEQTSFYILLISATIIDILPFMILFVVSLFMFSMPLLMLNAALKADSDPLIGEYTGWGPLDSVILQYVEVLAGFEPAVFVD